MRINPIVYGVLVLTVFFGIIMGFQAAGFWSISGKVDTSGEAMQPSATDVNTIKGWMTLEQIVTTYNVPLADLLKQFELPSDTKSTTAIKDLESDLFSVTNLRTWLKSRTQPAGVLQTTSTTPVPTQTVVSTPDSSKVVTPVPTGHVAPAKTITGKTTFQELLDWGVSKDVVQKVIGTDLPAPAVVIKDFVTGNGLEFTTIKTQLQVEVDKTK